MVVFHNLKGKFKGFLKEIVMKDGENKVLMRQMLKFQGNLEGNLLQTLYELKKSGGFCFKIEVFLHVFFYFHSFFLYFH